MTAQLQLACIALVLVHNVMSAPVPQSGAPSSGPAAFSLGGIAYFHRFTTGDQHEFTPAGQEDLDAWTDMVTLHSYRSVRDGEELAATANTVLETYRANDALVLKTDSVPRTRARPAEHLIVAVFARPEFVEVAFARFRLYGGVGRAAIHSHRIYGKQAGNDMQAWLENNGRATELNLMKWEAVPEPWAPK
jgi:hypothetical protein